MKISEIFKNGQPTLSLEVFPPKTSEVYDSVEKATNEIAALKPDFMSVTYGAAGSTRTYTTAIASNIENAGVTALAHLTCVNASKESIREQVEALKAAGIENILALRGDLPEGMESTEDWVYKHASELIPVIKEFGDFCIGGACYPEKHPEAADLKTDIANMKKKVDAGCEFLTTQMFFDNNLLYNYLYRLREGSVTVPVVAGIMPVTNAKQMARIIKLSQAFIPRRYVALLDRYSDNPAALKQAAIAYATDQIIDLLANGVNHIHVYTMNKPEVAAQIQRNLSEIIPSCRKAEEI
ncbi:MAG: methylenetetrahydrofolate reductase [NAD(P)H] [Lachnospiraceae bacterium]|nr:methylenetetrahydrofolate reductase [NAD(P)H] [Lachnospiraceae bacterium]MBP3297459.1 methylenetetrahydrofolate reductase [NAD(P)H] [Lachnospiraceae bacterium]